MRLSRRCTWQLRHLTPAGKVKVMAVNSLGHEHSPDRASNARQRLRRPGWRTGYAYIAPFFIVFFAFSLYPWIDTAWVSLHDVRLTTYDQQTWIGLDNYREPAHQQVLLERLQEHHHDRHHLHGSAAVHGARASPIC